MPAEKLIESLKVQNEMKLTRQGDTTAVPQLLLAPVAAAAPTPAPATPAPQAPKE